MAQGLLITLTEKTSQVAFKLSSDTILRVYASGSDAVVTYVENKQFVRTITVEETAAAVSSASEQLIALTVNGNTEYVNALCVKLVETEGSGSKVAVDFKDATLVYLSATETADAVQTAVNAVVSSTTGLDYYSLTTAITAFAGGGQGSATALTTTYNEITTCATAGDSVKLPAAVTGIIVIVKNNGATAADIFPATGDSINALSANTAIRIAPGSTKTFVAINGTIWEEDTQILATTDGTVGVPAFTFNTQPNMGLYKVSSTQLGVSVGGALKGGFDANGVFTGVVSEQVAGAGVAVDGHLLKDGLSITKPTPVAINATATATAAEIVSGYITSTSGAAVAITTPTATAIGALIGAVAGTSFDFTIDNSAGANTVTLVLDASIAVVTPAITGGATLTVSTANAIGVFRLVFTSTSTAKIFRIA